MPQIYLEETSDFFIEKALYKEPMAITHYHDAYELYYLFKGEREYFIGDAFYRVKEGDTVLIPPGVLHRTAGKGATRYLVYFSEGFLRRFFTEETLRFLTSDRPAIFRTDEKVRIRLEEQLENLLTAYGDAGKDDRNLAIRLSGELYHLLFTVTTAQNEYHADVYSDGRIGEIIRYINENYNRIESIEDIAARFFISKYHLCRIFSKNLGLSLIAYLNTIKIRAACEAMRSETASLTDIATACGFNSSSYFCKVFKSEKGITPAAYRRSLKKK